MLALLPSTSFASGSPPSVHHVRRIGLASAAGYVPVPSGRAFRTQVRCHSVCLLLLSLATLTLCYTRSQKLPEIKLLTALAL